MRSPLLAFSLVAAAAVSPSLVAAHSNSPKFARAVTHPRVTEVQNPGSNPLHIKRAGLGVLKSDGFLAGDKSSTLLADDKSDSLNEFLPKDKPAPPAGADKAASQSNTDPWETMASADEAHAVSNAANNAPVAAAEPAAPANPYGSGTLSNNAADQHEATREQIDKMITPSNPA